MLTVTNHDINYSLGASMNGQGFVECEHEDHYIVDEERAPATGQCYDIAYLANDRTISDLSCPTFCAKS